MLCDYLKCIPWSLLIQNIFVNHTNLYFPLLLHVAEYTILNMLSAQVNEDWGKESHFSLKKLSVRKQLFHRTVI